jgi:SAM-dependent methyltransferase
MSFVYRVLYRLRLTPWEEAEPVAPVIDLIEGEHALAPGRALDIGCGSGKDAIYCARNRWQVTAVDDVPLALARGRARAAAAGVDVRFERADISRTDARQIGDGYSLLLDLGCLHNLNAARREAAGSLLTQVAAPGATLLMLAFAPGGSKPGPVGIDEADVKAMFPAWDVVLSAPADTLVLKGRMARAKPYFHRLVKR